MVDEYCTEAATQICSECGESFVPRGNEAYCLGCLAAAMAVDAGVCRHCGRVLDDEDDVICDECDMLSASGEED